MVTKNVKLTVGTDEAKTAISGLQTSWVNAAAGMAVVEKAFNMVASAVASVNQSLRDSAKFFSAVKNDAQLASVQMAMSASDGMIKPMTLARGANTLMRGDLKLTQTELENVAKAAVELGRATGQDVNQVFDTLSLALSSGATRSLSQYGIAVDEAGTKSEKKTAILKRLTDQYGGLTIAVGDAAEAQDAAANKMELQTHQIAKNLDELAKKWEEHKTYIKDFWLGVAGDITGVALSAAQLAHAQLKRMNADVAKDWKQSKKLYEEQMKVLAQKQTLEGLGVEYAEYRIELEIKSDSLSQERLVVNRKMLKTYEDMSSLAANNNIELKNQFQITSTIMGHRETINQLAAQTVGYVENQSLFLTAISEQLTNMLPAAEKFAAALGFKLPGAAPSPPPPDDKAKKASDADWKRKQEQAAREAETLAKKNADANAEYGKWLQTREVESAQSDLRMESDYKEHLEKKAADAAELLEKQLKAEEKLHKESEDKKAKITKERLESVKKHTEELARVTINAITAEKSAREGLSKSEYAVKKIAEEMKAKAKFYAASAIGYAAQAAAALALNPPAAAALGVAALKAAAAAALFGAGGAALASGLSAPGGAGKSPSAPESQRAAVGGAGGGGTTTVNIHLGGRGTVLHGSPDQLAKALLDMIESAQRRGKAR